MSNNESWLKDFGVEVDYKISHVTYSYKDYFFDIVCDLDQSDYGCWLYHKDVGTKGYMFGVSMNDSSYNDFILYVIANLEEYICIYNSIYDV